MLSERRPARSSLRRRDESGFTLIEMCAAMLVLTVGLIGVASAISYALLVTNRGRNVTNTKLLITSVLEQMETLRNTGQLTFGQIANTGDVINPENGRGFAGFPLDLGVNDGFLPVSINPGPDGIHGTEDDLVGAGPDGNFGTNDDTTDQSLARPAFTRRIIITSLSANLKKVEVKLRYQSNGNTEELEGISYLNNDARENYR